VIEQIFFGALGIALLVLTFKLVHKEKYSFAFFVFVVAVASFLLTATWFQGLMKTGVISTVVSTLKLYGNRLDDFQTTITGMGDELSKHQTQIGVQQKVLADQETKIQNSQTNIAFQQENIASQYQQISTVQSELATAQTNLNLQAIKIQDVEYLVDNLFSKMVFENISASDTNQVAFINITNERDEAFIKLQYVPIEGSIQLFVSPGEGMNIPTRVPVAVGAYKNILLQGLVKFDKNKASFSILYVKDTREKNLYQKIEVRDDNCFIDNMIFWSKSFPNSYFRIPAPTPSNSK
jgi:hypothetical protein